MDGLITFLRARLDEDERAAAKAYVPLQGFLHRHLIMGPAWHEHSHLGGGAPHEHDPDTGFQVPPRAREVEAKRAILADCEEWLKLAPPPGATWSDDAGFWQAAQVILRHLAAIWRDHPQRAASGA